MYQPEPPPIYPLLVPRIIVLSLMAGVAVVLAYVLTTPPRAPAGMTMTTTAQYFVVPCLVAAIVLPWLMVRSTRQRILRGTWRINPAKHGASAQEFIEQTGDAGKVFASFQTSLIVRLALLEGPAFFAAVAYMLERHWPSLALVCALLVAMAVHFPTQWGVSGWVNRQLELLRRERELASLDRDGRPPRSVA